MYPGIFWAATPDLLRWGNLLLFRTAYSYSVTSPFQRVRESNIWFHILAQQLTNKQTSKIFASHRSHLITHKPISLLELQLLL